MKKRLYSFKYAWNGLKILFREEHNARVHLVFSILAVCMGLFLEISAMEWLVVTISIGFVVALEIINTSVENIANLISLETNHQIKRIKDLSAAAVFIASITSVIVGLIVFGSKLLKLFVEI